MPEAPVLVIEDERLVRDLLLINLKHAGFAVRSASDFESGVAAFAEAAPALAVVDVMMPGGDGFELTRRARALGVHCPILMLTARSDTASKVMGLDAGADDYLAKPFDVPELLARVRALLRRQQQQAKQSAPPGLPVPPRLELGPAWVRTDTGEAHTRDGTPVMLTQTELKLLEVFTGRENKVLSRAELLEEIWGMDASQSDRSIDNFLVRLRRYFEADPLSPKHFITVRGRGYLFRRSPEAP
jgi:two-component system, OmpR family, alkaline phosphatase synthesis response regulator PhoP